MSFESVYKEVKAQALLEYPKECCGFIIEKDEKFSIIPCKNSAANPREDFVIDGDEHFKIIESNNIVGYYHSHPTGQAVPSMADKTVCENVDKPGLIYSVPEDNFVEFLPCGFTAPYVGRKFVFTIHDCATLVQDFYAQEFCVKLEPFSRTMRDFFHGFSGLKEYTEKNNLFEIDGELKRGDILLMTIGKAKVPNHSAIYLGDNHILHQLYNRVSAIEAYQGYWKARTIKVVRHKKNL